MTTAVDAVTDAARRHLGGHLRQRVAGDEGPQVARRIWQTPGERRFGPDDPIWRVHSDASMFVGGLRALLLQSLHPLAMAGVAGHSGYRSDPWGRLQRTSAYLAATTFGTVEVADEAVERVRAVHRRVRGRAADGTPYRASDPELLGWVHAAEVDSFLAAYQRYGAARLAPADQDRYLAQTAVVARAVGVLDPPVTVTALRDTLASYRPRLRGTAEARSAARFLLLQPPLRWTERPGYGALSAGAVALLPWWARVQLYLPVLPLADHLLAAPAGAVAVQAVRLACGPVTPVGSPPERA